MAARSKPYEQFGPFVLFRKLESDALGDLWRAARIDRPELGPAVALRRLSSGNREALVENAHAVAQILPHLIGTSFVRDQQVLIVDGAPCISWEYAGGRSLRYIVDQARGTKDVPPSPLPLDQALVIAEKVALSLATMTDLRDSHGSRLFHGALLPQFVWISEDGEIRVAGQQMGAGIAASLADNRVGAELARYFAPEDRDGRRRHPASDVYSMGALLFLLVTGHEPPDAATASAFVASVRAARTAAGESIPDEIRIILDKSLNIDPSMRYASMADLKTAISAVAHGGKYSASTFNLAFYLSTLLKKELEVEAGERALEAKVSPSGYAAAAPRTAPPPPEPPPMFSASLPEPKPKRRAPVAIAALAVVIAGGAGGFMMMRKPAAQPVAPAAVAAQMTAPPVATPQPAPAIEEPAESSVEGNAAPDLDPEAQKQAFEAAVREKLQAEMMKLQNEFMADLRSRQAAPAPTTTAAPAPRTTPPAERTLSPEERATLAAAELDQQRRESRPVEQAVTTPPPQTQTVPPPVQAEVTQPATSAAPAVRQGDLIDAGSLDATPRPLRPIRATYPAIAARQKISATIILTALISEEGEVLDVRILRGDARFGLNDAAARAIRSARFSPPMKDGKRVRTWMPQTIEFDPN